MFLFVLGGGFIEGLVAGALAVAASPVALGVVVAAAAVVVAVVIITKTDTKEEDDEEKFCIPSPEFMRWKVGNPTFRVAHITERYWWDRCKVFACGGKNIPAALCDDTTFEHWLTTTDDLTDAQKQTIRSKGVFRGKLCACGSKKWAQEVYDRNRLPIPDYAFDK